jgi:hypothetical protein
VPWCEVRISLATSFIPSAEAPHNFAPAMAAAILVGSVGWMSVPFFVAGGLKIAYDLLLYRAFSSSKSNEAAEK